MVDGFRRQGKPEQAHISASYWGDIFVVDAVVCHREAFCQMCGIGVGHYVITISPNPANLRLYQRMALEVVSLSGTAQLMRHQWELTMSMQLHPARFLVS